MQSIVFRVLKGLISSRLTTVLQTLTYVFHDGMFVSLAFDVAIRLVYFAGSLLQTHMAHGDHESKG